jgi:hypothetical protein
MTVPEFAGMIREPSEPSDPLLNDCACGVEIKAAAASMAANPRDSFASLFVSECVLIMIASLRPRGTDPPARETKRESELRRRRRRLECPRQRRLGSQVDPGGIGWRL